MTAPRQPPSVRRIRSPRRTPLLEPRPRRISARPALAAIALIVVGLTLSTAAPASAHADLLETTPASEELLDDGPDTVDLRYTEPVQASSGGVRVFGPDGERVDRGSIDQREGGELLRVPVEAGDEGTYTVSWRVTSEDGHTISGAFVFHVGRVTGAVDIDDSTPISVVAGGYVGRWLAFAGTLVALGVVAIRLLGGRAAADGPLRRLFVGALDVGIAGTLLALLAASGEAAGRGLLDARSVVIDFASEQRTGQLLVGRSLALVVALGLAAVLWRRLPGVLIAPIAGAIVITSVAGHPWTTSPKVVAIASDVVHQLAVGVWAGGVVALAVALGADVDRRHLGRRFSVLALASVVAVAVTGSISGWLQLRSIEALLWTPYGQRLLLKVLGFAVLVYIGWWNRDRLLPLVERSVAPLRRSLRIEAGVVALVLLVTASLVIQPPGRLTVDRPVDVTVTEGALTMQVTVTPARAGSNDVHVYFFGPDGGTPSVDAVEVLASTGDVPPRRLTVTPISPSHVSAYGASLTSAGTWTLDISASQAGAITTFRIEVPIR
jgi:copper transport protein